MIKKISLLSCVLISFGYSNITETQTWNTKDVQKEFLERSFCDKSISKEDCNKNIDNLKAYGIDARKLSSDDIKNIELDKITYKTTNTFPNTGKITSDVSGLLMMPNTKHPKGVIVYYHPTVMDNSSVPSNMSKKNKVSYKFDVSYAAIFASQGYIVVAPDYIGQGDDYKNSHPYVLYPKQSVNTAVGLLNNVSSIIEKKYKLQDNDKLHLYSVGYSEGGAYSIWTAKCLTDKNSCKQVSNLDNLYSYVASAGLSGAYDISGVTIDYIKDDTDAKKYKIHNSLITAMLKPSLATDTIASYIHYGNTDKAISFKDFDKGFFNMKCSTLPQKMCDINGKHYTLETILNQKHISNEKFGVAVFNSSLYKKFPNQKSASHYAIPTGNNSILDLFSEKLFSNQGLLDAMDNANIYTYGKRTKKPLFIFALKEDSVVTPLNYDKFMKNSNAMVEGFVFDNNKITVRSSDWLPVDLDINNLDHLNAEPFADLFAMKYINDINLAYS